jgi:hypothetical protein
MNMTVKNHVCVGFSEEFTVNTLQNVAKDTKTNSTIILAQ